MKPLRVLAILAATFATSAVGPVLADDTTATTKVQPLNPLETYKIEDLKAFSERPLFSAERRPRAREETLEVSEPVKDTPTADVFTLLGVTTGPEGAMARIAISGKESRSVREGEEIDGWKVQAIDGSSVGLSQGDETMTLTIFNKGTIDGADDGTLADPDGGIVFSPADADETTEQKLPFRVIESK